MGTNWKRRDDEVIPVTEIYQGDRNSYETQGGPRVDDPIVLNDFHGQNWRRSFDVDFELWTCASRHFTALMRIGRVEINHDVVRRRRGDGLGGRAGHNAERGRALLRGSAH